MKKTLLSTAILAGLVSASAQAAEVYNQDGTSLDVGGRIEVRSEFIDSDGTADDKSRVRVNLDGETLITEGLTGFAFTEIEYKPDSTFSTRYMFAGFGTEAGDFSYGKQDTANVQVSNMTDIASYHSGIQKQIAAANERQDSTFAYDMIFADALSVNLDYIAADTEDGDSFGLSAIYALDFGLDLGASYSEAQVDEDQTTLAASYEKDALYLAASYAFGTKLASGAYEGFTSIELAAQYKLTKEFRLIAIYGKTEVDDNPDENDYVSLEGQYRFNNAIRTYVSYAQNFIEGEENQLVGGIRYNF